MPPFLLPFALLFSFFRELWDLLKKPKYRALLFWVSITLLTGTIFYNRVEGWGLLDSLYFSVITLTTVGYGDLSPTTSASKLFTIIYIFFGLSLLLAFINLLAQDREGIHIARVGKHGNNAESTDEGGES
jgi:hypothetical protein